MMATKSPAGSSRSVRIMLLLALPPLIFLHVYPWVPGHEEPLVLNIIPLPLLLWILWTAVLLAFVAYIAFRRDPYSYIAARVEHIAQNDTDRNRGQ